MAIQIESIASLSEYLEKINQLTAGWYFPTGSHPWFRGQSDESLAPMPSLFRKSRKEHDLTTVFIQRAGMYTNDSLPKSPAQWLSLMQHVGLPTRLLDWTESAAVNLYFAVFPDVSTDAAVWMLDPIELNKLSSITNLPASDTDPVKQSYQLAFGWQQPNNPPKYPIAVFPTHVHVRMAVQRGCFTIHGSDKRSFVAQFENHSLCSDKRLIKFIISAKDREKLKKEIYLLGIKHSSLFPDLDGLAKELCDTFTY